MLNAQLPDARVTVTVVSLYLAENVAFSGMNGCHTMVTDLSLSYYFPKVREGEKKWM